MKMVQFFSVLLCVLFFNSQNSGYSQIIPAKPAQGSNNRLTAKQWNDDIDYLVNRLEIMHPNLYASVSREAFAGYTEDLRKRIAGSTENEMIIGIHELMAHVKNLHTFCMPVLYLNDRNDSEETYKYYPVRYYPFKDGLYIMSIAEKYEKALGKKVKKIGTLTTTETMNKLAKFIPADNEMTTLNYLPRGFLNDGPLLKYIGASDSADKVTLLLAEADGTEFEYTIETETGVAMKLGRPFLNIAPGVVSMNNQSKNALPLYLQHFNDLYWFEYLPDQNAVYIQINALNDKEDEPFDKFCQHMFDSFDNNKAERLIIDVRLNTGGNHIELPLLKGIIQRPKLDNPGCLFLITGRTTVSASQHLTSELVRYTNVTLFGEPTCSKPNQYGAIRWFNLPNSKLQIGCAIDYYQDAQPYDFSMKTEPNFFISLSSSDFRDNRDPVMEAVLKYDSYKSLRSEFTPKLAEGYKNGGLEGLKKTYYQIKPGYAKFGYNMENLLYEDFDVWMGANNKSTEDYIGFLKFVNEEIPNSIRVIWDLGMWMKSVNIEEAKKYFNRCIEINPEHSYAKMELALIELKKGAPVIN